MSFVHAGGSYAIAGTRRLHVISGVSGAQLEKIVQELVSGASDAITTTLSVALFVIGISWSTAELLTSMQHRFRMCSSACWGS
jgi:hypothetical protein